MTEITINIPTDKIAFEIKDIVMKEIRREMESILKNNLNICFTEEEAAKKLGFENKETLARIRRDKGIEYCRLQDSRQGIRYTPEHIESYLKRHEIRYGHSG